MLIDRGKTETDTRNLCFKLLIQYATHFALELIMLNDQDKKS